MSLAKFGNFQCFWEHPQTGYSSLWLKELLQSLGLVKMLVQSSKHVNEKSEDYTRAERYSMNYLECWKSWKWVFSLWYAAVLIL